MNTAPGFKPVPTVWHDREIRFDVPFSQLELRAGEVEIDSINSVEDTKGNNGEKGALSVTNLRLIWIAHKDPHTNLSIGFNCVQNATIKSASSRLRGHTRALYIMTRFQQSRFQFVFTSLVKNSPRLFTTVQSVIKAYETSKLFRDLKLRGAIMKERQLLMLPGEEMYSQVNGVWNLSSDQGNLGTFYITNVRLVWHANLAENFNVSIPYMQMRAIMIRDSKFGHALVLETAPGSGGYTLGFRIDPYEKLQEVSKELVTLHSVFAAKPDFGVRFQLDANVHEPAEEVKVQRKADDVEIVRGEHQFDALSAYYADSTGKTDASDAEPSYSMEVGLAVEPLKEGFTLEQLWSMNTG